MDIDLLAKMVKEVVMDHDSVTLPGMGSFVAELVPASFADRGYTILPPYRRLYFSPKQGEDTLLAQLYARSNDVSEADASRILENFIAEMKEVLKVRKTLVLTGLGRLRATRENHFFFVADEDLDIYPSGFGLQPISLKTHEESPEEVAAAVSGLARILEGDDRSEPAMTTEEPEPVIEAEPKPVAEEPEPEPVAEEPEPEPEPFDVKVPLPLEEEDFIQKKSGWRMLGRVLLILLAIVILAAVALAVVGRLAPDWLDKFLYSPEELKILHP